MPLPAYPSSLGEIRGIRRSTGTKTMLPRRVVTAMDDGPAAVRRKSLYDPVLRTFVLRFTDADLATFRAFLGTTLNGGVLRFTAPVLRADGTTGTCTCQIPGDSEPKEETLGAGQHLVTIDLLLQGW